MDKVKTITIRENKTIINKINCINLIRLLEKEEEYFYKNEVIKTYLTIKL